MRYPRLLASFVAVMAFAGMALLAGVGGTPAGADPSPPVAVYVTATGGSNSGDCASASSPCATLSYALGQVAASGTVYATGKFTLSSGIAIAKSVTIDGSSSSSTTIDGGGGTWLFQVTGAYDVTFYGLTLEDGFAGGAAGTDPPIGGAITNEQGGNATVENCVFSDNSGIDGGAIANAPKPDSSGTLNVIDSTFTDNAAGSNGGAIDNAHFGPNAFGTVTITGSTFSGNVAQDGNGGAIDSGDSGGVGTLRVSDSTFDHNRTTTPDDGFDDATETADGGAIDNADGGAGTATVVDSTFYDNSTGFRDGSGNGSHTVSVDGGAIANADNSIGGNGTLNVTGSTFVDNSAEGRGDSIANDSFNFDIGGYASGGIVNAAADIFTGTCDQDAEFADTWGEAAQSMIPDERWNDLGYNAAADPSCLNGGTGDVTSAAVASDLGSLADNGGTTATVAPTTGNPALGIVPSGTKLTVAGTQVVCPPTSDQTGPIDSWPSGDPCEAGSLQLAAAQPTGAPQRQTITPGTPPAGGGTVGTTVPLGAMASSGLPVVLTVDSATTNSSCSVSGESVTFAHFGSCVIDINQPGQAAVWAAAPQVKETIDVDVIGTQTITFTWTPPTSAAVGDGWGPQPIGGGSTEPVTLTLGSGTTNGACTLTDDPDNGYVVDFVAVGTCVIDASEPGNSEYNAAPTLVTTIPVAAAPTSTSTNTTTTASAAPPTTGPAFTAMPCSGSPCSTGEGPEQAVFNASGTLLATANTGSTVSMFRVAADGSLTHVVDASTGNNSVPESLSFNAGGTLLATANIEAGTVSMFTVGTDGTLTHVADTHVGTDPLGVAFSPVGNLLAVVALGSRNVSVYTVGTAGTLTLDGTTALGGAPQAVAFSPTGELLAIANANGTVSTYTVAANGLLTHVGDANTGTSPSSDPTSITFSPNGSLLATGNEGSGTVSVFTLAASGAPTRVSETTSGDLTQMVSFSPDGDLLAAANAESGTVSIFTVAAGGTLGTASTLTTTGQPYGVAFSPRGGLLATSVFDQDAISMFSYPIAPPTVTIGSPGGGGTYALGQSVTTNFLCIDADPYALGVESCADSGGVTGTAGSTFGTLDTATPGTKTYKVTATSLDGETSSASITYTVTAPPPTGTTTSAETTTSATTTTSASAPSTTTPGSTTGTTATSPGTATTPKINGTATAASKKSTAPKQIGSLSTRTGTLGRIKLGMTRARALAAYPRASRHTHPAVQSFTVEPDGIYVGFLTNGLRRHLTAGQRKRYTGRVIWASTTNPGYHIGSVHLGAKLKAVEKAFPHGDLFHLGRTAWYVVHTGKVAAAFKLVRGAVKEVGVGTLALNETKTARRWFIASFAGS